MTSPDLCTFLVDASGRESDVKGLLEVVLLESQNDGSIHGISHAKSTAAG
jgi:hypothetical protein